MRLLIPVAAVMLMAIPALAAPSARDAAKLDKALAGSIAGKPQSCIPLHQVRSTQIVGDTILYRVSGRLTYRNDPPGGCPGLSANRTLLTRTSTTQLCSGDIVRIIDPPSPMTYGACGLGQFVPYRKAE